MKAGAFGFFDMSFWSRFCECTYVLEEDGKYML